MLVEPSREQVECYKHLIGKTGKQHVLKAIEISSYGTPEQVSPKIGAATRLAQEAVTQKHSIILVTAFTPTANILRDTLANFSPILVDLCASYFIYFPFRFADGYYKVDFNIKKLIRSIK